MIRPRKHFGQRLIIRKRYDENHPSEHRQLPRCEIPVKLRQSRIVVFWERWFNMKRVWGNPNSIIVPDAKIYLFINNNKRWTNAGPTPPMQCWLATAQMQLDIISHSWLVAVLIVMFSSSISIILAMWDINVWIWDSPLTAPLLEPKTGGDVIWKLH